MASNRTAHRALIVLAAAGLLGACGGDRAREPDGAVASDTGMSGMEGHDMSDMGAMTMPVDADMMRRHAAEMDSMANALRSHVAEMRQLPQAQWHARMDRHAPLVARMLGMMERQIREMDMGMNMDAGHMGAMMGMTGAEYQAMQSELAALRTEVGQLQTAAPADVRTQMPTHLDRLERVIDILAQTAQHMESA